MQIQRKTTKCRHGVGTVPRCRPYYRPSLENKPRLFLVSASAGSARGSPPDAAWRMMARRALARSSPCCAARTYHTLASSVSCRHPTPISLK